MKKSDKKFSKKNRNIISGIMVGLASIYAVASYFDLPQNDINRFFILTTVLLLTIMFLAIFTVLIMKAVGKIIQLLEQTKNK